MKKILMMLVVAGMAQYSAEAQSKFAENYKVCKYNNGYAVCGHEGAANTNSTALCLCDNNDNSTNAVEMNKVNSYEGYYRKHNIIYSDDMRNPYEGLPSRQNDGPDKTWERNLNYLSAEPLPGSDGSMPKE